MPSPEYLILAINRKKLNIKLSKYYIVLDIDEYVLCCSDIDECTVSNPCHEKATCNDTYGSYNCSCNSGFTGDGLNCTDIDECEMHIHDCHVNGTCVNTDGSFNCLCGKLPYYKNSAVWYNEVPGSRGRNCTPCMNISGIPVSLLSGNILLTS